MERLEPVLKQKFWILLGIGIIMTIVGWWMATGTMAATITTRQSDIKAANDKIPGGEIPNGEWSSGLATLNTQQELAVKSASKILWERQRAQMTWPETVAEFAWEKGYQGEIRIAGRENYRTDYDNDCIRVWETCQPFSQIDGSGIVDYPLSKFPRLKWSAAPTSKMMWEAQEDLWLMEGLLKSIAELNGGANSTRLDACVHQIEKLTLHGGLPASQRTSAAATGGGGGGGGAATAGVAMPTEMPSGGGFGGGGGAGTGGSNSGNASSDFDVKEEFGDDSDKSGGGGGGGSPAAGGAAVAGVFGAGSQGGAGATLKRYIDDDAALPFKTRGFYMTVIMDHRKIPNLIAELTASEKSAWPIEIVRVQFVRLHEDNTGTQSGGGGGVNISLGGGGGALAGPGSGGGGNAAFGAPSGDDVDPSGGATAGNSTQSQVAVAALKNALQDPNMARVSLCGIISLYKQPAPEAAASPAGAPPASSAPVAGTPTEPASTPTETPTAQPTDADTAAETKPATTTEGEPGTSEKGPTTEEKPKEAGSNTDEVKKDEAKKEDASPAASESKPPEKP